MAKKKAEVTMAKLTAGELDLLSQMQDGYQLETNSLGGNPVLRRLTDHEVIRPISANASSVKALQERKLIHPAKDRAPLTVVWRLSTRLSSELITFKHSMLTDASTIFLTVMRLVAAMGLVETNQ